MTDEEQLIAKGDAEFSEACRLDLQQQYDALVAKYKRISDREERIKKNAELYSAKFPWVLKGTLK